MIYLLKKIGLAIIPLALYSCATTHIKSIVPTDVLAYCDTQARKTVNEKPAKNLLPVVIDKNNSFWKQGCG
ncbi:MAG: hypothetical protein WAT34_03625 [Chitinophagaceae bacterium]